MVLLGLPLASMILYLIQSSVLCGLHSDEGGYKMMVIPEVCVPKVINMLKNVAAFCEANETIVNPRTTSLLRMLQHEREKSRKCRRRMEVVTSLLELLVYYLSQSKERIRGMFGIAIRYQGNRTSLNDLLNRNHEVLLDINEEMVREIDQWRMNTSMWEFSYRGLDTMEECRNYLQQTHKKFIDVTRDHDSSQKDLNIIKESDQNCNNDTLIASLNMTEQKLKQCIEHSKKIEENSAKEENYKDILLDMINELEKQLNETVEAQNNSGFEQQLESKLEECKRKLNVNTEDKETFHKALNLLKTQIVNETSSLFDSLEDGLSNASNSYNLLNEVRDKYEALRSVCGRFVEMSRQKTAELMSCENENSNWDKKKTDIEDSLELCQYDKYDMGKQLDIVERKLRICNETIQKEKAELDEARWENERLLQNISKVTEMVQKCNASLKEELKLHKKAEDLGKQLSWEEDRIKVLENDKQKLIEEVKKLREEKEELLKRLKSTDDSVRACKIELDHVKIQGKNRQQSCEGIQKSYEDSLKKEQSLEKKLKESSENSSKLEAENVELKTEVEDCRKEKESLQAALIDKATEIQECLGQKFNLSNTSDFKSRRIQELEFANMNLTSKLSEVKFTTSINELDIKLRYLEYLINSNRNEIKMLQEYGVILITLVIKNAEMLSFIKETLKNEEEGCAASDEKFDAVLRRLLRTVDHHHSRIYTQLIQLKPYMDKVIPIRVRRQVQRGRSPEVALRNAAAEGNTTEVGILLTVGVNVNGQDESGLTPLHYAAMNGQDEVVELLLCRGAQPNIQASAKGQKTPLHFAAFYGHLTSVIILLDYGADIEARALDYATPLLYAASNGQADVVKHLLLRGANIRSANAYNKDVYELAKKYPDVLHVLHEYTEADCDC